MLSVVVHRWAPMNPGLLRSFSTSSNGRAIPVAAKNLLLHIAIDAFFPRLNKGVGKIRVEGWQVDGHCLNDGLIRVGIS